MLSIFLSPQLCPIPNMERDSDFNFLLRLNTIRGSNGLVVGKTIDAFTIVVVINGGKTRELSFREF